MLINIQGIKFRADLQGVIGGKLAKGEFYERHMLKFIGGLDFKGECVDIGCFIGTHTLYFNKKMGRFVYAFDKENHVFREHLELNKTTRVQYFNRYLLPPERLIDLINVNHKIGLIKIDVDGSDEIDVLTSCKEVIEKDNPIIFIEARTEEKLEQIKQFLKNYKCVEKFNATPTYYFKPL